MREFPVTVPSSHVYHINSSASNLFDDDQYQRKLPAIESDINCSRFHHQTPTSAAAAAAVAASTAKQSYTNNNSSINGSSSKNATNYICTSNGDLTSLQSGRLQNFTNINNIHNNNYNRSHKVVTAIKSTNSTASAATAAAASAVATDKNVDLHNGHDGDIICADVNRAPNANGSYSIFDAITNAVASGHCANTIYPANERSDTADFDQINLSPDPLTANATATAATSTSIHNLKNPPSSHINNECGQFQHYNYHHFNNRTHQFPSANYKHSYLLWIGTPVAARYCDSF